MPAYVKNTTPARYLAEIERLAGDAVAASRAIGTAEDAFRHLKQVADKLRDLADQVGSCQDWLAASLYDSGQVRSYQQLAGVMGVSKGRADQRARAGRERGNPMADPGTAAEQPVVAVAIIVHPDRTGVLMEHRRDEAPPWTFPAAEIQPGESPAQALKRRVPGETGMIIDVDHVIDARLHPRTGRFMRYLVAHLRYPEEASTASAQADDPDADRVAWVSKDQLPELAPDLFGPVAVLLGQALR